MDRLAEFDAKRRRIAAFLDRNALEAVLYRTRSNISWLGCGPAAGAPFERVQGSRSEIWAQGDTGVLTLLATPELVALITENIELPRLTRDEFGGLPLTVVAQPWHENGLPSALVDLIGTRPANVATDLAEAPLIDQCARAGVVLSDRRAELAALRYALLPREIERYRWLGLTAGTIMSDVCRSIRPGMMEPEVVSNAHGRLQRLGIAQEVDIVCSDVRLWEDRHGLYSDRRIDRYAMVVFCAHKWGLVANLTRLVHLGPAPAALRERHRRLAAFDRRLMEATRPGVPLAAIFRDTLQPGYAALGEPDAWRDHHQGGSTGYAGRDQRVIPTTEGEVQLNQAFAWNPSLPGVKSEDTFLATAAGPDVLTVDPAWPVYPDSGRPTILELA